MNTAIKILKTAKAIDKTTAKGRAAWRLNRGKFERLFLTCSEELHDSAMRTFDRLTNK
jgi:hypothetical protein